jgi:hypothetical protein
MIGSEYEDTGRGSTYEQESVVSGAYEGGLSAKRLGEANEGVGRAKHPALYALGYVAVGVAVIGGLVLFFTYT